MSDEWKDEGLEMEDVEVDDDYADLPTPAVSLTVPDHLRPVSAKPKKMAICHPGPHDAVQVQHWGYTTIGNWQSDLECQRKP
jgi:hypothetical protein